MAISCNLSVEALLAASMAAHLLDSLADSLAGSRALPVAVRAEVEGT